jgi:hypothetical protein
MQSCACALGKYNIRCNALLPGTIKTQLNEKDLEDDAKRKYMEGRIPLGRTGVTKDLAGPAIFLGCEELSGYVVSLDLLRALYLSRIVLKTSTRLVHNCWLMEACSSIFNSSKIIVQSKTDQTNPSTYRIMTLFI